MKNSVSTLKVLMILLMFTTMASAQSVVMLHHAGGATPFYGNNGFNDAYTASVSGDTIYLPGRYFNNPSLIDKRLVIVGTGHYPDSSSATLVTHLNSGFTIGENADSIRIEGCYINGNLYFASNAAANYALIKRNFINGSLIFDGDRVTNPNYHSMVSENVINGHVQCNNAIQATICNNVVLGVFHSAENCYFTNNLSFGCSYWGWPYYNTPTLFNINACVLENNVFTCGGVLLSSENNVFTRNLWCGAPGFGSNIDNSNYFNVAFADIFVNASAATFDYAFNFHLKTPASYIGADGNEVGLYGGIFGPYKEGAVPFNPHISFKNVAATTDSTGKLNVQFKVSAQQK